MPQHRDLIEASAINKEVFHQRGYRSMVEPMELHQLGFAPYQTRAPGLLLPVWTVDGEIGSYQYRPDVPRRDRNNRPIRYETPKGSRMLIDVPPATYSELRDPNQPLIITEGIRKADAAVSAGFSCIALLGVWNWRGTNDHGGKVALPDWHSIALNGRKLFLAFDSDAATNPGVRQALEEFGRFLTSKGAMVCFCHLGHEVRHE